MTEQQDNQHKKYFFYQNEKLSQKQKQSIFDTHNSSSYLGSSKHSKQQQSIGQIKQDDIKQSSPENIKFYNEFMGDLLKDPSISNFVQFAKNYSEPLINNKIRFAGQSNYLISLKYSSNCMKVVVFQVYIAFFVIEIEIYNQFNQHFDEMIEKKAQLLGKGSQGQIFKLPSIQGVMKRAPIVSSKSLSQSLLNYSLFQYAINKLVSALQIGPKVLKPFMFDIICSKNYIYFFIQECQKIQDYFTLNQQKATYQDLQKELKKSLCLLHKVQVVHYDIKPQNIMYSPSYNKFVFIDFGLAQSKVFKQGWKQIQYFKGTYFYCSDDMKERLIKGKGFIDAYFNDCFCLYKTLSLLRNYDSTLTKGQLSQSYFDLSTKKNNQLRDSFPIPEKYQSHRKVSKINQKKHSIDLQANQEVKDNYFQQKLIQNHTIIHVSYLLYHSFQDRLQSFFQIIDQISNFQDIQEYLEIFFQFSNFIYQTKSFQSFIQKFIKNNNTLYFLLGQQILSQKQIKRSITNLKNDKKLTQEMQILLLKYPFLVKIIQKYFEKNRMLLKEFQTIFCFVKIPKKELKQQIIGNPVNKLSQFYDFGILSSYSADYYGEISHYLILADYYAYLFNIFVEFSQDLKDKYRFEHFFGSVGLFFDKLSVKYDFFKQNTKIINLQGNYEIKLNIVRQSLEQFNKVITESIHSQNNYIIFVIEKSLYPQISKFRMVCMKLQRLDLMQDLKKNELQIAQRLFFCYYNGMIKCLINILECQKNSQINKTLITQTQLLIKNSFQKLLQVIYKKALKVIEIYYEQNQNYIMQNVEANKIFFQKFIQSQKNLQKIIKQIKLKFKVHQDEQFSPIKLLLYQSLPLIYMNQQVIDSILFFKKFQSLLMDKFSTNLCVENIQQKSSNLRDFIDYLNRKYGDKLKISFLIYDQITIGQILFELAYKSYIHNGFLLKSMKMLESQIKNNKNIYQKDIEKFWQILRNYYYDMFAICDILGYEQKMLRISKIVSRLQKRQFNLVSFPLMENKNQQSLEQQNIKTFIQMKGIRSKPFIRYKKFRYPHERMDDLQFIKQQMYKSNISKMQETHLLETIQIWKQKGQLLQMLLMEQRGLIIGLKLIKFYNNCLQFGKLIHFMSLILGQLLLYGHEASYLMSSFQKFYIQQTLRLFTQHSNNSYQSKYTHVDNVHDNLIRFLSQIYNHVKSSFQGINKKQTFDDSFFQVHQSNHNNSTIQSVQKQQISSILLTSWLFVHIVIDCLKKEFDSQTQIQNLIKIIQISLKILKFICHSFDKCQDEVPSSKKSQSCDHQQSQQFVVQSYLSCAICVNNFMDNLQNDEFQLKQIKFSNKKFWKLFIKLTQPNYFQNIQMIYEKLQKLQALKRIFDQNQKISKIQNDGLQKITVDFNFKYPLQKNNVTNKKIKWLNILTMRKNIISVKQKDPNNSSWKKTLKSYRSSVKKIMTDLQNSLQRIFNFSISTKSQILQTLFHKMKKRILQLKNTKND